MHKNIIPLKKNYKKKRNVLLQTIKEALGFYLQFGSF